MPIAPERAEQPQTQAESSPAEETKSFRELAMERLANERGDAPRETAEAENPEAEPPEQSSEVEGEPTEAEVVEDEIVDEESEEEQPESDVVTAIEVEGHQFTADEIKKLLDSHDEAVNARKEYDADYRRKTQWTARVRQEYEAQGREVQEVSNFFVGLAEANVKQLESLDPSQMSQEEFAQWRTQLQQAQQGRAQLLGMIQQAAGRVKETREKHLNDAAKESAQVLQSLDSRWNNEFYGKIRDWAVQSERYSAEEFADVVDWRTMEGLIALYDRDQAKSKITETTETNDPPTKRRRQRARESQSRDAQTGRFVRDAQKAVTESRSAKADGSLRTYFQQRLAQERKG